MPDYAQLGSAIRGLAYSHKFNDADDLYYSPDAHVDLESRDLWKASGFASPDSPSLWDTPELAPLSESASLPLGTLLNGRVENELLIHDKPTTLKNKGTHPQVRPAPASQHKHTSSLPAIRAVSSTRSIPSATTSGASRPLNRAPSATTTTPSSRTTSTSSVNSSIKPAVTRPAAVARPRSQTTSQFARPSSAPSTKLETNAQSRAGTGVPNGGTLKAQVPVARSKTATSVYATTSRATPAAPAAPRPQPARLTVTRPAPVTSRTGTTSGVTRMTSVTTGKAAQPRTGSAPGQWRAGVTVGVKPTPAMQDECNLLRFDDLLGGDEDFVFDI